MRYEAELLEIQSSRWARMRREYGIVEREDGDDLLGRPEVLAAQIEARRSWRTRSGGIEDETVPVAWRSETGGLRLFLELSDVSQDTVTSEQEDCKVPISVLR